MDPIYLFLWVRNDFGTERNTLPKIERKREREKREREREKRERREREEREKRERRERREMLTWHCFRHTNTDEGTLPSKG